MRNRRGGFQTGYLDARVILFTDQMIDHSANKTKNLAAVELGRRGGQARAKALTAKERKAIAMKASRAAAKKRTAEAKAKKKTKAS